MRVLGETHHHVNVAHLVANPRQSLLDLPAKTPMEQQVLGRVPAERQLGEQHQVGAELGMRAARVVRDAPGVARHIPDEQIDLRQRDPQRFAHAPLTADPHRRALLLRAARGRAVRDLRFFGRAL